MGKYIPFYKGNLEFSNDTMTVTTLLLDSEPVAGPQPQMFGDL